MLIEFALQKAIAAVRQADALLICVGAGMGVDSGLPDFRGVEGFWRAYPPFARLNLTFEDLAQPHWFETDPALAWGFYGHRLNLYRAITPHAGFTYLRQWGEAKPSGLFVFTSNVDGQFQQAGFDPERIVECHGSLHFLQCCSDCSDCLHPVDPAPIPIDEETLRAIPPFPSCPDCGKPARPNVLMFGDWHWNPQRTEDQEAQLERWLRQLRRDKKRLTIIECGAGKTIPTVRRFSDVEAAEHGATLIRINPHDYRVPHGQIALPLGALEALTRLQERMG